MLVLLFFAVVVAAPASAATRGLFGDLRLVQSGADGVDLAFLPDGWTTDTLPGQRLAPSFAGAQWSTEPGAPAYPQRSVVIAVPPAGDISVSASASAWRTLGSAPVRRLPLSPAAAAQNYQADQTAPSLVRWEGPFWVRDIRAVRIWLAPVQPTARGLSAAGRVDVQVRWSSGTASAGRSASAVFDPVYRSVFLNAEQAPAFAVAPARGVIDNPFAGASEWYKVLVTADGPSRITRAQLAAAGFPVGSSDPRNYRMFYAGGKSLPVPNNLPRPGLKEIPIDITGAADGSFDQADAIYFFGQAANRWENEGGNAVYRIHPYARETVFWIVPDGSWGSAPLRIDTSPSPPGADLPVGAGIGRAVAEQNRVLNLDQDDFYTWYWQKDSALSVLMNLPDAQSGPGTVAVTTLNTFGSNNARVVVNGVQATFSTSSGRRAEFSVGQWLLNTNIQLTYLFGQTWMDRVEAIYPRALNFGTGSDEFWLPAGTGNRAQAHGYASDMILWDVTRPDSPFAVSGLMRADTLEWDAQASIVERRFRVFRRAQAAAPSGIVAADPGQLRQNPPAADMLIITHPSLAGPLSAYRSHREQQSGISVEIVDVLQIYDDFGFGQFDPVAIRDFLKYTYLNATVRPSAVLMVGDGSYDYLNYQFTGTPNLMPPFIVSPIYDNTAGDQNFVSFGPLGTLDLDTSRVKLNDRGWDMMIARWPARTAAEVQIIADKIRNYETAPEFGLWRNRIILVADDEFGEPPSAGEYFHTQQAEEILTHVPPTQDIRKIYLFEYPFDAKREKPEAREELVAAWNDGMLMIDYVGHGSPNVWAHEDVFRRAQDVPRLFNGSRLPLVYTASCSIGQFDDPLQQGMGEELLRRAGGGAVGIISATRLVFSQPNVDLNEAVMDFMLGPGALSVGQALFAGLIARQYQFASGPVPLENDRKHILFCDPFVHLAFPDLGVEFDSAGVPDSLFALKPYPVVGRIVDSGGQPVATGGELVLSVRDAPRPRQYQVGAKTVTYSLQGRPIFEGRFPFPGSDFDLSFFVPKDISYGADGARIEVYALGTDQDALGVRAPIPVAQGGGITSDVTGPTWTLTINGKTPQGRWPVSPTDSWHAQISDPLGINIGGGGHGISVTVDGDEFGKLDITSQFHYDLGSFSSGSVSFKLPLLEAGDHDVRLLAWDNANNPGALMVPVTGTGATTFEVRDFLVYPNPFHPERDLSTRLTYDLTFPPDFVELSVLTVAGNRVRTIRETGPSAGFNYDATWDGRDDTGDPVAAGVYLLALEAHGLGRKVKEFTKIVVVRSD